MKTEIVYQKKKFKYPREVYLGIKEELKTMALEQKEIKHQRVGDARLRTTRFLSQQEAAIKVSSNKVLITCLHVLYNIIREKEHLNTEHNYNNYILNRLKKKYLLEV